jgi:hypothetical protein
MVTVLAVVAIGIAAIVAANRIGDTSVFDLGVGDCLVLPGPEEAGAGESFDLDAVDVVDCAEPHDAEVVAVGDLNPDRDREYPTDDELFAEADRRCVAAADVDDARFGLVPIVPNEASWEPLNGRFVCLAVPFGGALVAGSITEL